MSDFLTSLIRTWVPILVGYLVSLGLLPASLSDSATAAFTALVIGVYYALVRVLETRWPAFGWLLGSPKKPTYVPPA